MGQLIEAVRTFANGKLGIHTLHHIRNGHPCASMPSPAVNIDYAPCIEETTRRWSEYDIALSVRYRNAQIETERDGELWKREQANNCR